jgi:hypothetical protein
MGAPMDEWRSRMLGVDIYHVIKFREGDFRNENGNPTSE